MNNDLLLSFLILKPLISEMHQLRSRKLFSIFHVDRERKESWYFRDFPKLFYDKIKYKIKIITYHFIIYHILWQQNISVKNFQNTLHCSIC